MVISKKTNKVKITNNACYCIIDKTIYVFLDNISDFMTICKKVNLIMEDNNLAYVNISMANLEKEKEFFLDLGFTLSYFDIKKLNLLYRGYKNKDLYRCYGFVTKKDFENIISSTDNNSINTKKVIKSDDGFVLNISLLFGGIILLCFFCVYGAISLVK